MKAIIERITLKHEQIEVGVTFDDGSVMPFIFPVDTDRLTIRQTIKTEVLRRASSAGKVATLAAALVGAEITDGS